MSKYPPISKESRKILDKEGRFIVLVHLHKEMQVKSLSTDHDNDEIQFYTGIVKFWEMREWLKDSRSLWGKFRRYMPFDIPIPVDDPMYIPSTHWGW